MSNLDNFFKGDESVVEAPVTETKEALEAPKEETKAPEPESPKVDEKGETTTPETDFEKLPHWAKAAVKDERSKRQALERELSEYKSRQQQPPQNPDQAKQQTPDEVDFYQDPDKWISKQRTEMNREMARMRVEMSEMLVKGQYQDFDEKITEFQEAAKVNPLYARQMLESPNPALFAYEMGKKIAETKAMQDPEKYREKLKAEIRAEIEAEQKANQAKSEEERKKLSASITGARSTGAGKKAENADESDDAFEGLFDPKTRAIKRR